MSLDDVFRNSVCLREIVTISRVCPNGFFGEWGCKFKNGSRNYLARGCMPLIAKVLKWATQHFLPFH